MRTYIQTIFGAYTPSDPTSIAGADWEFIAGLVIFSIMLYCVLRMIGSLFK